MATKKICGCGNCLNSICVASDSNLTIRKCWCAECKERRAEIKSNAWKITAVNGMLASAKNAAQIVGA